MITSCLLISWQKKRKNWSLKKILEILLKIKNIKGSDDIAVFHVLRKWRRVQSSTEILQERARKLLKHFCYTKKKEKRNFPCFPGVNFSFKKAIFTLLVLNLKLFMTTSATKEAIVNISDIFLTLSNECIELQNHKTTEIIRYFYVHNLPCLGSPSGELWHTSICEV